MVVDTVNIFSSCMSGDKEMYLASGRSKLCIIDPAKQLNAHVFVCGVLVDFLLGGTGRL